MHEVVGRRPALWNEGFVPIPTRATANKERLVAIGVPGHDQVGLSWPLVPHLITTVLGTDNWRLGVSS